MEAHAIQGSDIHRTGTEIYRPAIANSSRGIRRLVDCCQQGRPRESIGSLAHRRRDSGLGLLEEDWDTFDHRSISGEKDRLYIRRHLSSGRRSVLRYPRETLMRRGLEPGATMAPINDVEDLLAFDHLEIREFWRTAADDRGFTDERIPGGFLSFDGKRLEAPRRPPRLNEHGGEIRDGLAGASRQKHPRDQPCGASFGGAKGCGLFLGWGGPYHSQSVS